MFTHDKFSSLSKTGLTDDTRRYIFAEGMTEAIGDFFTVSKPLRRADSGVMFIFADFSDGSQTANVGSCAAFSDAELAHMKDERILFHGKGQAAGQDLMTFLANAVAFEQHIRGSWWWKGMRDVRACVRWVADFFQNFLKRLRKIADRKNS